MPIQRDKADWAQWNREETVRLALQRMSDGYNPNT